jgi:hypothetical protein
MWQRAVKFLLSREVGVSAFGGLIPTVILGVIRLKSDAKFKEGLDGVKSDLSNFRKEVKSDLSNLRKEVTGLSDGVTCCMWFPSSAPIQN